MNGPRNYQSSSYQKQSAEFERQHGMNSNEEKIAAAIAKFPATFGLRSFAGMTFRISRSSSYISNDVVMLYTESRHADGKWGSFAKGTVEELQAQIETFPKFTVVTINPSRSELWQLHRHGCQDTLRLRSSDLASIIEAPNVAEAEKIFFDAELLEMGYQPGDGSLRVMPCCKGGRS